MCLCVDLLAYNVAIHHPVQNTHAHTSYTKALWLVINYCFVAASACHCTRKCVCLRLACVHVCVPQGLNLSSSLINWGNVGDLASCTHNEFNYELTLCTIKPIALSWLSLCVCVCVCLCVCACATWELCQLHCKGNKQTALIQKSWRSSGQWWMQMNKQQQTKNTHTQS